MLRHTPASLHPGASTAAAVAAALIAMPPPRRRRRRAAPAPHVEGEIRGARGKKATASRSRVASNLEGKVVLLPLRDDDDRSFTTQVERLMRARGVDVVTDVRGVDTPEQFRELATHLGIAAFVEGTLKEREGDAISKVTVQVRSGYTGRKLTAITSARPSCTCAPRWKTSCGRRSARRSRAPASTRTSRASAIARR